MMTAAQQHRHLGASVDASDDLVILKIGTSATAMRPEEFRTFLRCGARALFRADIIALSNELEQEGRGHVAS